MFSKGYHDRLVWAKYSTSETPYHKHLRVVYDFLEVFPEELLEVPLEREIDFRIYLLLDTQPIFILPY